MITYAEIITACKGKVYRAVFKGDDAILVKAAVNQGIDAHLEACFVAGKDAYDVQGSWIHCYVSPESLPVLMRRLCESGKTGSILASDILSSLGLEGEGEATEIVSPVDQEGIC